MTQIILNDDQLRAVQVGTGAIEVRDRHGTLVGYLTRPASEAEIAEASRRLASDGPWFTTQQVFDHLDSLDSQ